MTIFSVVDTAILRPLPYAEPDRLVAVREVRITGGPESGAAPGRLEDWHRLNSSFEGLAGCYADTLTDTSGSTPEQLPGAFVSPRFFRVLRSTPLHGRAFTAAEEEFGGPQVVIISHRLWQRRFGSDPKAVGSTLSLSGKSYEVIGVMPASFHYPSAATEFWIPKKASPALMQVRAARFYRFTVGRMNPRVTIEQARADLHTVQSRLGEQYPKTDVDWTVRIDPLKERQVRDFRLALWLLFGSSGILLLTACINVACLLLAQFSARAEEVATRRALGASHATISRQLLAEGFGYSIAGSAAGVLIAYGAVALARQHLPELPRISELAVDARVLSFAAAIAVSVATLVSLAPIARTWRRNDCLVRTGRGVVGSGQKLTRFLVSAQLALATVLLVGSGLFFNTLLRLQETDLGFRPEHVLTFRISGSFSEGSAAIVERHRRTMGALSSLPGVQSVSMSNGLPGTITGTPSAFRIEGHENAADAAERFATERMVTAGYFQTLGIPVLSGQTCAMDPDPKRPFEAVVNRAFVDRFLPERDAVGRTISVGLSGSPRTMRIAGVAADTREGGYARAPEPLVYICGFLRFWPDSDFLLLLRGSPDRATASLRQSIQALEPSRAVYGLSSLGEVLSGTLSSTRFRAGLVSAFSGIALLLAAVGCHGPAEGDRHSHGNGSIAMAPVWCDGVHGVAARTGVRDSHGSRRSTRADLG